MVKKIAFFLFFYCLTNGVWAKVYLNQEQALELAFSSETKVERIHIYLKKDQIHQIQKLAKSKLKSELLTYYVGQHEGRVQGYAFFVKSQVRTMPETFMVVLTPTGQVDFVEMLAFFEPEDYLPPKKWFDYFKGKELTKDLRIKRGIRNITGSTLSTQSITDGVRRVLAAYNVLLKETR